MWQDEPDAEATTGQAVGAVRHEVLDRTPPNAAAVATVEHFSLAPGARANAELGLGPGWSLYSLEHAVLGIARYEVERL